MSVTSPRNYSIEKSIFLVFLPCESMKSCPFSCSSPYLEMDKTFWTYFNYKVPAYQSSGPTPTVACLPSASEIVF